MEFHPWHSRLELDVHLGLSGIDREATRRSSLPEVGQKTAEHGIYHYSGAFLKCTTSLDFGELP